MKQLPLPIPELSDSEPVRFMAARMAHAPLREVFRSLWASSARGSRVPILAAVASERARGARDDAWRRRLWWLIGDMWFRDDTTPWRAIEAFTHALESRGHRPAGFDIACLAARATCLARVGLRALADEDQICMHALITRTVPPKHRGEFLFRLAEEQWSDYGLLDLALENYLLGCRAYERADDQAGIASCEAEAGKILYYQGRFDESLVRLLRARRLWRALGERRKVAPIDGDLAPLFYFRHEARRMLGAATRKYLAELDDPCRSSITTSSALRHQTIALNALGRMEERDQAMLRAIWMVESDTESPVDDYLAERSLDYRVELLRWRLARPDIHAALQNTILLLPRLPRLDGCPPRTARSLILALGRAREVFGGVTLADSVTLAKRALDRPVPADVRWVHPHHLLVPYYLGRGLVRN